MSQILKQVKEDSQQLLKVANISPDGKIPRDTYLERTPQIDFQQKSFVVSAGLDA